MADRKFPGSIADLHEIKSEVEGDRFETTGYYFPPSGFQSFTYADLLYYVNNNKEGKLFNYALLTGGADNLINKYCTICKESGHDIDVCLRPYVRDWPGFPINGIAILERPIWIPPLYRPQVETLRQHRATLRRQRWATRRRQQMQMFGCLHMPVRAHSLQRTFNVLAPSIYGGRIVANREQPHCSLCGATGQNICICGILA